MFRSLTVAMFVALPGFVYGMTILVSPDGEDDYSTIGDAMAAAVSGDTVRVAPGIYRESVGLKSGVVLQGSGYEDTRIEIDTANPIHARNVSEASVQGFSLAYTGDEDTATAYLHSSEVKISSCRISNTSAWGVYADEGSDVTVEDCLVEENAISGILILFITSL